MINWEQIRHEYENEDISLKALAEKYGISPSTVRSRKNREGWQRNDSNDVASRRNATGKRGGQLNNKNAVNNKGGGPPPNNKNAVSHGLFAKWLPEDTTEILRELYTSDPADIIWNNIMIQYTAIIRSQKIMMVHDEFDKTSDLTSIELDPKFIDAKTQQPIQVKQTRQYQYAWDKQANFLNAQSRAMGTLSNLVKQFMAISDDQDERRKKLELMDAQIAKLKSGTPTEKDNFDSITIVDAWSGDDDS